MANVNEGQGGAQAVTTIVRPAAVAGSFYPADAAELTELVDRQMEYGRQRLADLERTLTDPLPEGAPKAVIVPHAGYVYSGTTAALAYALLERGKGTIKRVVVMGPTHRVPVRGVAMSTAVEFATPLGKIAVDTAFQSKAADLLLVNDATHEQEHAVEVQLPFVQRVLGEDVRIVPLNASDATPRQVGDVLRALWGGPETAVIISSDLSHYHPELAAQAIDNETIGYIAHRMLPILPNRACGAFPVGGLLDVCIERGLAVRFLGCSTSGEHAEVTLPGPGGEPDGERPEVDPAQRVVGYASFAVWDDGESDDGESDGDAGHADDSATDDSAADDSGKGMDDSAADDSGKAEDDVDVVDVVVDDADDAHDAGVSDSDVSDDDAPIEAGFDDDESDDDESDQDSGIGGLHAGEILIDLARLAVEEHLGLLGPDDPTPDEVIDEHPWLQEPGASFVTLTEAGNLRGCIGSLRARQPLGADVAEHAVDAATHDPRFAPVDADEYDELYFEVSVLSEPETMDVRSRSELEAALDPQLDGLIIDDHAGHSATFLPQVWEQLPSPTDFVAHLLAKAGLPSGFTWNDGEIACSRYQVTAFAEAPDDEE